AARSPPCYWAPRRDHPSRPSAVTAAAWWTCLPTSIPTHTCPWPGCCCSTLASLVDHHHTGSAHGGDPTGSSLDSDGSQVSISGQGAKRTGRPLLPGHTNSKHCIGHTQPPQVSRTL